MADDRRLDQELPFPLSDVSNGEWCPRPPTPRQTQVKKLALERASDRARRLGMSRREFLRTAAGTATVFMAMNSVYGLPSRGNAAALRVSREHCDDPEAGRELFKEEFFVMDVQCHHVDLEAFGDIPSLFPLLSCLRFVEGEQCTQEGMENLSQANMIKEIFVDSETAVGVISGTPSGIPLPAETMARTRDLVNALAGSQRALSQAICDPANAPGTSTSIDSLEHQIAGNGGCGIKTYPGTGQFFLDDEAVAYPMYEESLRLGNRIINVHKGLPAILGGGAYDFVRTHDLPKALADWPRLKFVIYHSGYFPDQGDGRVAIQEFLDVIRSLKRKQRRRVYAEIGSSFATAFLSGPENAAHFIGSLMKELGSKRILWGTDAIWWGSPQWIIDAFKALEIPESMQEQFGYPALTKKRKARILGRNAARLYRVKPRRDLCDLELDQLAQIQQERGGIEKSRSFRVYGPRTAHEYRKLVDHEAKAALRAVAAHGGKRSQHAAERLLG
jgi:predicted TIM-barrel fold metal-dependent hydrolase